MLNVYAWSVCPHCHRTIEWLKEHRIPFHYLEIEEQPKDVIQKVIDVNGGDDWVVPTLEYNGQWLFWISLMRRKLRKLEQKKT